MFIKFRAGGSHSLANEFSGKFLQMTDYMQMSKGMDDPFNPETSMSGVNTAGVNVGRLKFNPETSMSGVNTPGVYMGRIKLNPETPMSGVNTAGVNMGRIKR
jgi:hypothetical protein